MPFGEELAGNIGNRLGANAAASNNFTYGASDGIRQKFTGYQKDTETGLDFAEARMYENRHGRFTAVDPLLASGKSANPLSFNRYAYVFNSPLVNKDPTGMQVRNRKHLSYTNQMKDYVLYEKENGLQVRLFTRPQTGTVFSRPLQQLIDDGIIVSMEIPL